jgi:hypothetical protein
MFGQKDNVTGLSTPSLDFRDLDGVKSNSMAVKDDLIFPNEQDSRYYLVLTPEMGSFSFQR